MDFYKPSLLVMDSLFRSSPIQIIQAVCPAAAGPRIQAADVADWATVKDPEVRLLQPDGTLLERFLPAAVASGQLHRVAMVKTWRVGVIYMGPLVVERKCKEHLGGIWSNER